MNGGIPAFLSALAQDLERRERFEVDTAAAYEAFRKLDYNGPAIVQFQHGIPQTFQLLHPITWKLT